MYDDKKSLEKGKEKGRIGKNHTVVSRTMEDDKTDVLAGGDWT